MNRRRAAERRRENFGERAVYVRGMPCLVGVSCSGPIEAAHVRSRGAGGTRRDLVPLCQAHHREQHQRGKRSFAESHGLDLEAAAARVASALDEKGVE